jgi:hypothetical protein
MIWAQSAPPAQEQNVDASRIGALIARLGSSKFQERNAAQKQLEAIGAPALEALKKSLASADLETKKRAGDLIRRIEEKALNSSLLAPKRVRLKVTDMPALDAVAELAQLSGYPIQVLGDRTKLADKKITLDTGDVSFWEALDKLCNQAGLAELVAPQQGLSVNINEVLPQGFLPPRAVPVPPAALPPALPVLPPPKPRPAPEIKANPNQANNLQAGAKLAWLEAVAGAALAQAQAPRPPAPPVPPPAPPVIQFQLQKAVIGQAILDPVVTHPGITLIPAAPKNQHLSYAGSVRIRAYALPGAKPGEYQLALEASAEPRLQDFNLVGMPSLEKVIDEEGQTLSLAPEPTPPNLQAAPAARVLIANRGLLRQGTMPLQRQISLHLKAGAKPSHMLKEFSGSLTAQVFTPPEPLVTLNNVLKRSGETAQGKSGGALELGRIDKLPGGDYKVQVHVENPPGPSSGLMLGNGLIQMQQVQLIQQIQVGVVGGTAVMNGGQGMPELLDAAGRKFQVVQVPSRRMSFNNGAVSQDLTIIYRGPDGAGEPDRLVLHGSRPVTLTIPFSFKDVALMN